MAHIQDRMAAKLRTFYGNPNANINDLKIAYSNLGNWRGYATPGVGYIDFINTNGAGSTFLTRENDFWTNANPLV